MGGETNSWDRWFWRGNARASSVVRLWVASVWKMDSILFVEQVSVIHSRDFSWKPMHACAFANLARKMFCSSERISQLLSSFFFSCLCAWDASAYMSIKFNLKFCNNVLFRRNVERSTSTWRFIRQFMFQLSHRCVCFWRLIRLDYYAKVVGKWKQRIVLCAASALLSLDQQPNRQDTIEELSTRIKKWNERLRNEIYDSKIRHTHKR